MGILNVTPDSFSDGGRFLETDKAIQRGMEMIAQGADIVDVGGESTRPGAEPVSPDEEMARVIPVIEALSPLVRVSIDTKKVPVAEVAISAGATIINDVSASLETVAAKGGVGWVAMHSRGDPKTMAGLTAYGDLLGEVRDYLRDAAMRGRRAGVEQIWVDPGIGFAKTAEQNFSLIGQLDRIVADGTPVLVGASRKSFLAQLDQWPSTARGGDAQEAAEGRDQASLAMAAWSMIAGASVLRVHDVLSAVCASRLIGPNRSVAPHKAE
ncbi:MAG TPA: dihydropteroate synthase [Acidimicrobiales bacterium]|nr:dihydropteroate synthase [Acidimicrobiales bacterium]